MLSENIDAPDENLSSWHWTDYLSHYRYWALSLGLFFIHLTVYLKGNLTYRVMSDGLEFIFPLNIFATLMGLVFALYVVRKRFKSTLIWSSILYVIFTIALFFFSDLPTAIDLILVTLSRFCSTVFWGTCIFIILQGRSDIKSLGVIAIGTYVTSYIGAQIIVAYFFRFEFYDVLEEPWQKCLVMIPALISIILIAFANRKFFTVAPVKTISPMQGPHRSSVLVAILSAFIPFYYYYFMATRPRELKAINSDIKTPTGGGMVAIIMFAGILAPIWYAHTRSTLKEKYPENALLQKRSHKFIGFISFLFPVFGAAMIQSDMNAIAKREAGNLS